jgi:hypothetical protein
MLEVATIVRQAARFFQLEVAFEHIDEGVAPPIEAATRVRIGDETRLCVGRPKDAADQAAAEEAETRNGFTGMSQLAFRCETVWLVEATGEADKVALQIAAVLASVVLGPILAPAGGELFGVKTARAKLERLA